MNLQRCIYCEREAKLIGEDWLPRAFGKFRDIQLLKERVCAPCNEEIGKHEEPLMRSSDAAVFRTVAGVEGRHGRDPLLPYKRGSAGLPPIRRSMTVDRLPIKVPVLPIPGSWNARETRAINWKLDNGDEEPTILDRDIDDASLPALIERDVKRIGRERIKRCLVIGTPDEHGRISAVINQLFPGCTTEPPVDLTPGTQQIETIYYVNNSYWRAVSKIAFHYVLKYGGRFRGDENEFRPLRQFIRYGEGAADQFAKRSPHQPFRVFDNARPKRWSHYFAAFIAPDVVTVHCLLFVGPEVMHNGIEVRIGSNPSRLWKPGHAMQQICHRAVYDSNSAGANHHGFFGPLKFRNLYIPDGGASGNSKENRL